MHYSDFKVSDFFRFSRMDAKYFS